MYNKAVFEQESFGGKKECLLSVLLNLKALCNVHAAVKLPVM